MAKTENTDGEQAKMVGGPPPEAVGKPLPFLLRLFLGIFASGITIGTLVMVLWILEKFRAQL